MNLSNFNKRFRVISETPRPYGRPAGPLEPGNDRSDFTFLIDNYGGMVFDDGLYKIHDSEGVESWTVKIGEAYPQFSGQVRAFGQDWQGNQFGWRATGDPGVLLFQIGSGASFEIADSIESAHEIEFVQHPNESLSLELWRRWIADGGHKPRSEQCVGLKQPLFLGGEDRLENMHLCNAAVYWDVSAQLLQQVRNLPPGTPISNVRFDGTPTRIH